MYRVRFREVMIMRSTMEKLSLFRRCFIGRKDVYGTYDPATGRVRQVKGPVTDAVLKDHLRGKTPYGFYMLMGDRTTVAVADFDDGSTLPPLEFINIARQLGLPVYLERSKSKGYHVWMFGGETGVLARAVRLTFSAILRQVGQPDVEIFPKQDRIDSTSYGNFINAPFFYHSVLEQRTVFLDDRLEPYPDQWEFLSTAQLVSPDTLDQALRQVGAAALSPDVHEKQGGSSNGRPTVLSTFGLRPCAQRMLREGVTANQRVACFRLAIQLRKAGLPEDCAYVSLEKWAARNHPHDGRTVLNPDEIKAQVKSAYGAKQYHGCGCQTEVMRLFCDPDCSLRTGRKSDQARTLEE